MSELRRTPPPGRERLPRAFYARDAVTVARELLGKTFVRRLAENTLKGRIVEAEAYTGQSDPGSHAFRGKTRRTEVMFGPAGHLYVYFTYGMHYCLNVVTDQEGVAGAVLIRALEPFEGIEVMAGNRHGRPLAELCNGPGKLCQAFGITREQNGIDLETSSIWLEGGPPPESVSVTTRVGLSAGAEYPFRFFVTGNRFVSPGRPSVPNIR